MTTWLNVRESSVKCVESAINGQDKEQGIQYSVFYSQSNPNLNPGMETIRYFLGYPDSYYNCSGKTYEEWMETGEKWPILGHLLMILGTVYMIFYLPTIYAMIKLNLTKNDCYKIMFFLILADMGNLIANSFIAGYIFSIGGVFCMNDVLFYISGAYNFAIWAVASYYYILLAFNRLVIVLDNKHLTQVFTVIPISLWILGGLLYGIWIAVGTKSIPFNSKAFSCIYVPAIESLEKELPMYANIWHVYHNVGIGVVMSALYTIIFVLLGKKRETRISKAEMSALVQAILITIPAMSASWLYVYIQFFQVATREMAIAGHFLWQTTGGISAFIYLIFNPSIREFYRGNRGVIQSSHMEDSRKSSHKNTLSAQISAT